MGVPANVINDIRLNKYRYCPLTYRPSKYIDVPTNWLVTILFSSPTEAKKKNANENCSAVERKLKLNGDLIEIDSYA